MSSFSKFLSIAYVTLGVASPIFSATLDVACDYSQITNAINIANAGDTIIIQPGTCTISDSITIKKALTLRGSGTNLTTLVSGRGLDYVFKFSGNFFARASDLNCVGDVGNKTGFFATYGGCQYHFYNIQMTNVLYRGFNIGNDDSFGLVDHCTFICRPSAANYNPISFGGNGYASWSNAIPYGTTNVACVEDCYFAEFTGDGGNGFFDGYDGAQCVIRYCYFDGGAYNGTHGYDSQPTSVRSQECYNNIFTNWNINAPFTAIRGGGLMVFSNTIYLAAGGGSISPKLQYYRGAGGLYQGFNGYAGYHKTNTYLANWVVGGMAKTGINRYYYFSKNLSSADRVLIGTTLQESLTNLADAINLNPAAKGVTYHSLTKPNNDFYVVQILTNGLVLRNKMDGTNASFGMPTGYPAAFQPGMIKMLQYTNTGVVMFPCYGWSNVLYTAGIPSSMGITVTWAGDTDYVPNYETNIMVLGRDYINDVIPETNIYQPLIHPHPLQAEEHLGNAAAPMPPNNLKSTSAYEGSN